MDSGESLLDFLCLVYTDFLNKREHRRQEEGFQNVRGVIICSFYALVLHYMQFMFLSLPCTST